ncbi:MAG: heavy-metal-associated domain-containing protein, partial [Oscillospiraceae bacterium]|nr:heavy-metal-associated domain-containing protein [Oscillospiraceae bacterium]
MQDFVLRVDGMMCPHCEASVRKILEGFPEVQEAVPDREKKQVTLRLKSELTHLEEIKQALVKAGYQP